MRCNKTHVQSRVPTPHIAAKTRVVFVFVSTSFSTCPMTFPPEAFNIIRQNPNPQGFTRCVHVTCIGSGHLKKSSRMPTQIQEQIERYTFCALFTLGWLHMARQKLKCSPAMGHWHEMNWWLVGKKHERLHWTNLNDLPNLLLQALASPCPSCVLKGRHSSKVARNLSVPNQIQLVQVYPT